MCGTFTVLYKYTEYHRATKTKLTILCLSGRLTGMKCERERKKKRKKKVIQAIVHMKMEHILIYLMQGPQRTITKLISKEKLLVHWYFMEAKFHFQKHSTQSNQHKQS